MSTRKVKPFILEQDSDGCTLMSKPYGLVTGGKRLAQRGCCDKHDEWYHYGGSKSQRQQADRELRDCVRALGDNIIERGLFKVIGMAMYIAVRVGGSPKLPFPWRWRNNVNFQLEDLASGYLLDDINYDNERLKDVERLRDAAEAALAVVQSDEDTSGIEKLGDSVEK